MLITRLALQCVLLTFRLGILTSIKGIQTLFHRCADMHSPFRDFSQEILAWVKESIKASQDSPDPCFS